MEIKLAEYCGFCYGVKRAVEMAEKAAEEKVNGATLGPLIHNPQFIAELESKGIACKEDLAEFRGSRRMETRECSTCFGCKF